MTIPEAASIACACDECQPDKGDGVSDADFGSAAIVAICGALYVAVSLAVWWALA